MPTNTDALKALPTAIHNAMANHALALLCDLPEHADDYALSDLHERFNAAAREALSLLASEAPAPTCATCAERADYNRAKTWRPSGLKGLHWAKQPDWELCQRGGKGRCSVWLNGTWHTWDVHGVGGENGREATVEDAFREAEAAMIRQGWAKLDSPPAPATQEQP